MKPFHDFRRNAHLHEAVSLEIFGHFGWPVVQSCTGLYSAVLCSLIRERRAPALQEIGRPRRAARELVVAEAVGFEPTGDLLSRDGPLGIWSPLQSTALPRLHTVGPIR